MFKKIILSIALLVGISPLSAQTLNEAVARAMKCHPEIRQNEMQQLATQQAVREAKGSYYPSVDITAGYGREKTVSPFTQDLENTNSITLNRQEFNGTITQSLFAGGGIVNEVKRNYANFVALNFRKIATANDIALEVTEAYLNVLLQKTIIRISKENLRKHNELLGLTRERASAGVSRQAELSQAIARVNLARTNLINAEGNLQEARIKFRKLVGIWPATLTKHKSPTVELFPTSIEKAVPLAMSYHPQIKSAAADIKEARAKQKVAASNLFPKIDAVFSAGRNRNLDGLEGKNFDNIAAVRMTFNAFKGGADLANTRKAAFEMQEAIQIRNNTMIDVREALGLSYNSWGINKERTRVLKKYVSNVQKTKSAYFEQYKIGKRSLLDLLNVQNEEYNAEVDYLRAINDENFAKYRILNNIGTLLPFLDGLCTPGNCSQGTHTVAPDKSTIKETTPKMQIARDNKFPDKTLDKKTPLKKSNNGQFTIQVLASKSLSELKSFAQKQGIDNKSHYAKVNQKGKSWYVLTVGEYQSLSQAKKAISSLPNGAFQFKPWVRTQKQLEHIG